MVDILQALHPRKLFPPRAVRVRVVIFVIVLIGVIVLIACHVEPQAAVWVVGAAGVIAVRTAAGLLAATPEPQR
ncbi:hypothetical protein K7711_01315 [Nocardia sp. CA2R105]|uniref:hypothetical protein n=1 Tax=Nocardia coffeae TaxID=2873381 RepID=UPI001CA616EB|nr:hypothetical protein [Nocardia coffeae]MBY8855108.1 hypothetical protein [Nocardia coffeae]